MNAPSILEEIHDNQHRSGVEHEEAFPSTTAETPSTNYRLMFASMLIGALVGSVLLAPVLALYIEDKSRCIHLLRRIGRPPVPSSVSSNGTSVQDVAEPSLSGSYTRMFLMCLISYVDL